MNKVIFIIGVSGVGKSTIAKLLSKDLSIPYFDADDYHSEKNIKKMTAGQPLDDLDRHEWLVYLNNLAKRNLKTNSCLIACSALKEKYRDILNNDIENRTKWVHLTGSFELIFERLEKRTNHFMSVDLLKSQFEILESPDNALQLDVSLTPNEIAEKIKNELFVKSEIGLLGLGVMGKSLSRNLSRSGFQVSMYNRHIEGKEEDVAKNFKSEFDELSNAISFDDIQSFVNSIQRPRKILFMVNAGDTVDIVIESLLPYLSENDILIDGGNSNYLKTNIRFEYLKTKNIHFIGAGISGGEKGALNGPSIMPGGEFKVYESIKSILETIAAKDKNGVACCNYIGPGGSGHFVKMVHNGIEYVEMQLLAEVYSILKCCGNNPDEIASILETWRNDANSFLLDITITILRKKEDTGWLIQKILDKAGNKGTGNWATIASSQLGTPSTMIATALFSRYISSNKEERIAHHENFRNANEPEIKIAVNDILASYKFARIINHYQGFKLIADASQSFSWNINLSEIARIWTSGCIIKSDLMQDLVPILANENNLLKDSLINTWIKQSKSSATKLVSQCVFQEIAVPCISEAVQFLNGITTANSSANIIQAQRDYFGAHTYQRRDDDTEKQYHTNWN